MSLTKPCLNFKLKFLFIFLGTILVTLTFSIQALAKGKKVQEVNFNEMSIKGSVRNPDGAYLVQKRGVKFMALHEVKKDMDKRIRNSSFYAR